MNIYINTMYLCESPHVDVISVAPCLAHVYIFSHTFMSLAQLLLAYEQIKGVSYVLHEGERERKRLRETE